MMMSDASEHIAHHPPKLVRRWKMRFQVSIRPSKSWVHSYPHLKEFAVAASFSFDEGPNSTDPMLTHSPAEHGCQASVLGTEGRFRLGPVTVDTARSASLPAPLGEESTSESETEALAERLERPANGVGRGNPGAPVQTFCRICRTYVFGV